MGNQKIARFCVGIDIYDNEEKKDILNEGVNLSSKQDVIGLLEEAIIKLRNT